MAALLVMGLAFGVTTKITNNRLTVTYLNATILEGLETINVGNETPTTNGTSFVVTGTFNTANSNGHGFTDEQLLTLSDGYNYASFDATASMSGVNDHDHYNAFQARPYYNVIGNTTYYRMYYSYPLVQSGNVTNLYHFEVGQRADTGGAVTNEYGLYIADLINNTNQYAIYTAGSDDLSYLAGNVGIAVTPDVPLDVSSGTDNTVAEFSSTDPNAYCKFTDDTNSILFGLTSGTRFEIKDAGATSRFIFDTVGMKMGIGTAAPDRSLSIDGAGSNTNVHLFNTASGGTTSDGTDLVFDGTNAQLRNRETGRLSFWTDNSLAMNIDSTQEINMTGISSDGNGKVVCIKADGNLGTCTDQPGVGGTCTCA